MKIANTSQRLKQLMTERNLRQIDILNLTKPYCDKYNVKMNKSDISQYVSGKNEPSQDKLVVLGMALNVQESWLMGYDSQKERGNYEDQNILMFEAKLEEACNLLRDSGYSISFSDDNQNIIIKNASNEVLTCMQDYELVNKYESLYRKGIMNGSMLIEAIETYGLSKESSWEKDTTLYYERKILSSFSQLNDEYKKKCIVYTENLLCTQKMEEALMLSAANQRTDIAIPEYEDTSDDDIMDDENF